MNQLIGYLSEGEQLKGSLTIPKQIGGGGGGTLETITKTYTPTTSQQTEQITPSSGYDGIAEVDVTVNAMPTGTEGTPTATKGAVSNHAVQVTPSVTNVAGYIAGGTKTGTAVTVSASELDSGTKSITANGNNQDVVGYAAVDVAVPNSYSAADEGKVVDNGALVAQTVHADVTPTTSDQTIDTTLNNSLKVKGDTDLVAGNIKKDVEIFGVTGSYEGSGGDDAVMRQVVNIGTNGLRNAVLGEVVNFSSLTYMGEHAFQYVSGPKTMVFPKLSSTANYPVSDMPDIETIDTGSTWTQANLSGGGWFFSEDKKLTTLILRRSSVIGMPNINCFNKTPFASDGIGGTLYVPQSLISSYQSASNWSTILGYANNSIVAIEGSQYENYYADGTPVT